MQIVANVRTRERSPNVQDLSKSLTLNRFVEKLRVARVKNLVLKPPRLKYKPL